MKKNSGLTLIELMLVVGLLGIFLSLGTIFFNQFVRQDQLELTAKKIVSCLEEARAKTLAGYSLGGESGSSFGVYFETDAYTLFPGTVFNPNEVNNQRYELPESLELGEIYLVDDVIVFEKVSGEVLNFDADQNRVVLDDLRSYRQKQISVNKLGVAEVE